MATPFQIAATGETRTGTADADVVISSGAADERQGPTPGAYLILLILCFATLLNVYDRFLIIILVEPIKAEFGLSDAQLGLLTGIVFSAVYAISSIPIAHLADRGHHRRVLAAAICVWSAMTGVCGFAANFVTLAMARMGVAVGEAGGLPTIQAIVAQYFPAHVRARAMAAIAAVTVAAVILPMMIGGYVNDQYGWRAAFWVAVPFGFIVSIMIAIMVKDRNVYAAREAGSLKSGLATLHRRRANVWMVLGISTYSIGFFAMQAWTPAFLMREFGLSATRVGLEFSPVALCGTLAGTLLAGLAFDRLALRDCRYPLWALAVCFVLLLPFQLLFLFAASYPAALAFSVPVSFLATLYVAPSYALVQQLSGPELRSTAAAVYIAATNIIGFGIGPPAAGLLSDLFGGGGRNLNQALAVTILSSLIGAMCLARATRTLSEDLKDAE